MPQGETPHSSERGSLTPAPSQRPSANGLGRRRVTWVGGKRGTTDQTEAGHRRSGGGSLWVRRVAGHRRSAGGGPGGPGTCLFPALPFLPLRPSRPPRALPASHEQFRSLARSAARVCPAPRGGFCPLHPANPRGIQFLPRAWPWVWGSCPQRARDWGCGLGVACVPLPVLSPQPRPWPPSLPPTGSCPKPFPLATGS